jgi:hypothetical protein
MEYGVSTDGISDEHLIVVDISLVDQELDESVANLVQFRLGQDPMIVDRDDCVRLQLPDGDRAIGSRCASGAKNRKTESEQDIGKGARSFHDDLMMVFGCLIR